MKKLMLVAIVFAITACGNGQTTGKPNSGVIPQPVERNPDGTLVYDTEKLPMTGQWCHELDEKYRRISNCVAPY